MKISISSIVQIAMGAAIIAVLSQLSISVGPVPFTLQTFAVGLIVSLFRWRESFLSVVIYLFMGLIGLPVFAGGSGGFQVLFGPTCGFLWGFLLYAAIAGGTMTRYDSWIKIWIINVLGDAAVFLAGTIMYAQYAALDLSAAFKVVGLPFIIPDLIKISLVTYIIYRLHKFVGDTNYKGDRDSDD